MYIAIQYTYLYCNTINIFILQYNTYIYIAIQYIHYIAIQYAHLSEAVSCSEYDNI